MKTTVNKGYYVEQILGSMTNLSFISSNFYSKQLGDWDKPETLTFLEKDNFDFEHKHIYVVFKK